MLQQSLIRKTKIPAIRYDYVVKQINVKQR